MTRALVLFLAFISHVQAGTLNSLGGDVNNVLDNSCASVKTAMQVGQAASGWYVIACSTDPVVAGSTVAWLNVNTKALTHWTINSINAPAAVPISSYVSQVDSLLSRVIALESAVAVINAKLAASPAVGHTLTDAEYAQFSSVMTSATTPYDYSHGALLFASVFTPTLGLYFLVRGLMQFYELSRLSRRVV